MILPRLCVNSTKCWYPLQARAFIRHPSDVPIRINLERAADQPASHPCEKLDNISLGGLAFRSPKPLPLEQSVKITFPLFSSSPLTARVVWVTETGNAFNIGLQFDDPDELYCLRMIEQICHIEHYRREVKSNEGRELNTEQAAREWIPRYAHLFPGLRHG